MKMSLGKYFEMEIYIGVLLMLGMCAAQTNNNYSLPTDDPTLPTGVDDYTIETTETTESTTTIPPSKIPTLSPDQRHDVIMWIIVGTCVSCALVFIAAILYGIVMYKRSKREKSEMLKKLLPTAESEPTGSRR